MHGPRLLFVERDVAKGYGHFHMITIEQDAGKPAARIVDVPLFIEDMCNAAEVWLSEVRDTEPFVTNYTTFARRHPEGVPPFVVGGPVFG